MDFLENNEYLKKNNEISSSLVVLYQSTSFIVSVLIFILYENFCSIKILPKIILMLGKNITFDK